MRSATAPVMRTRSGGQQQQQQRPSLLKNAPPPPSSSASPASGNSSRNHSNNNNNMPRFVIRHAVSGLFGLAALWLLVVIAHRDKIIGSNGGLPQHASSSNRREAMVTSLPQQLERPMSRVTRTTLTEEAERPANVASAAKAAAPLSSPSTAAAPKKSSSSSKKAAARLSPAFDAVLERARTKRDFCQHEQGNAFAGFDDRFEITWGKENRTLATLPAFGIIDAIESYKNDIDNHANDWPECQLPPETECDETQLTAIFMAYNPDRLGEKTFPQIKKLLAADQYHGLIKECVLVWNGERHINESAAGRDLLEWASHADNHLRVVYPLQMGFPNDLMNRYHPEVVKVTTKGILYYDDDGPFYSYKAIEGGFELWKRHAPAQMGAMSRQINYSPRQQSEFTKLVGGSQKDDSRHDDKQFVSHCDNLHDRVEYNFYYFANYNANMVLPSGSMLHSNYLCFLWHPVLQHVRQFVLDHPVHPDDITVSTVVSHLAGRAPRVYSRRLNPDKDGKNKKKKETATQRQRRRLTEEEAQQTEKQIDETTQKDETTETETKPKGAGIGGICWDCGQGMTEKKQIWADLRSQAINTLIRYFGSINSGSVGWCEGTPYYNPKRYKDGKCEPIMAKQGWLPWMNPNGSPKATCP